MGKFTQKLVAMLLTRKVAALIISPTHELIRAGELEKMMRLLTEIHTQELNDILISARVMFSDSKTSTEVDMFRASFGALFCEEGAPFGAKITAYEENKARAPEVLAQVAVELEARSGATSTLKSQGCRFMLSPDGRDANWVHPAEIATRCPEWSDCTEMSDEEFQLLIGERRAANPPIAA